MKQLNLVELLLYVNNPQIDILKHYKNEEIGY